MKTFALAPLTIFAAVTVALSTAAAQQSEDRLTADVGALADRLSAMIDRAGNPPFTLLPFQQAAGGCTALGGFLADELIVVLQGQANSGRSIIDRGRLRALLDKRRLGMAALLEPETASEIGSSTGLEAVGMGTITEFGPKLRVTMRLVSTQSGNVVAAGAVTIGRDELVNSLLTQPITTGAFCGNRTTESTPTADAGSDSTPISNSETASAGTSSPDAPADEIAALFHGRWEGFLRCEYLNDGNWTISYDITARSQFDISAQAKFSGQGKESVYKTRIFFADRKKPIRFDTQTTKKNVFDYSYKMTSDRTLVGSVVGRRDCETMLNKVGG